MHTIGIPVQVRPDEIARKQTLGAAIELCAESAGFTLDKQLQRRIGVDKAQFSRWLSGAEGIVWPKLVRVMDECGNDIPVFWQLHQRGYDLNSIRKRESETERALRAAHERIAQLEHDKQVLVDAMHGKGQR